MKFITKREEYESILAKAKDLVNVTAKFPDAILHLGSEKLI